jgi:hypothetical protein
MHGALGFSRELIRSLALAVLFDHSTFCSAQRWRLQVLNADQRKKLRNVQQYLEKTLAERKGTIIEDLRSESVNTDDR